MATHYTEAVFGYHHVNAWEIDGAVQLQIMSVPCANTDGPAQCKHMNAFNLKTLRDNSYDIPRGTSRALGPRSAIPLQSNAMPLWKGRVVELELCVLSSTDRCGRSLRLHDQLPVTAVCVCRRPD